MPLPDEVPFRRPGRSLALAFALGAAIGVHSASAQTVIVQSAPPGSAIELLLNGASAATATADANGDATLAVGANRAETDVLVFIDSCAASVRVQLAGRGTQAAPALPACGRVDVGSMFIMRPETTFVVDVTPSVSVHVAQGPPPPEWLLRGPGSVRKGTMLHGTPAKGFVASVGAGGSIFGSIADKACGDVAQCLNSHSGIAFTASAEYWFTRAIAAQIAYVRPADVTVNGAPTGYTFESRVQTRLMTISGKGGVTIGPARVYGQGGTNRHEATYTTTQTIADKTVVVDNVPQTIPGGTQAFGQKTSGWDWTAGGGVEAWANDWVALYGELNFVKISGRPVTGIGDSVNEDLWTAFFGLRVHIGR